MAVSESLKRDFEYLLWLLSRRDYPEKKLREKLKSRGVSVEGSDELLAELKQSGYFSEERFRKARARQLTRRGDGPRSVKAKLKSETGIDISATELEEVYSDLGTTDLQVLKSYLEKESNKLTRSGRFDAQQIKQKLIERAMRKGFNYDQTRKVLQEMESP
jgi:regulatory protein